MNGTNFSMTFFDGMDMGGIYLDGRKVWEKPSAAPASWLRFKSSTAFTLGVVTPGWDGVLYTSTDTETWSEWDGSAVSSSEDGALCVRGVGNSKIGSTVNTSAFLFTDATNLQAIGNIETLLDWETVERGEHPTMAMYCYRYMFYNCKSLVLPPELPAVSLSNYCYGLMFQGCVNLKVAPSLPATSLEGNCYYSMFYGCVSLKYGPALPATVLGNNCYYSMFRGCTGLIAVPKLPATAVTTSCYYAMFRDCSGIKVAETCSDAYPHPWRIPTEGAIENTNGNWSAFMLTGTGGTFTSNPSTNTTYYTANAPT